MWEKEIDDIIEHVGEIKSLAHIGTHLGFEEQTKEDLIGDILYLFNNIGTHTDAIVAVCYSTFEENIKKKKVVAPDKQGRVAA